MLKWIKLKIMEKLSQRQEKILELIVREYVEKPKPIGSEFLAQKLRLSSATIRNEMKKMEKIGYLIKPHISAGRIPSDKAYRFFIQSAKQKEVNLPIKITKKPIEDFSRDIAQILAEMSGSLAFSAIKELKSFYQAGLSNLLRFPEIKDRDYFSEMAEIVEKFEKNFDELFEKIKEDETRVFIGSENPLGRTRRLSIIISKCKTFNNKHAVIGLLGPTRMRYDYNLSLINKLKETLEDFNQ